MVRRMGQLKTIWNDILVERQSQDAEHGGAENDDRNTQYHWVALVAKQLGPAVVDIPVASSPVAAAFKFRRQMVRVAALSVAAVEWVDRVIEAWTEGDDDG